jgi:epoxyqueuosine reductase
MSAEPDFGDLVSKECKYKIISISHLADLKHEIKNRQQKNEFDTEFAVKYLPSFEFSLPQQLPETKSLIIVAMPRLPTKATFTWKGKKRSFILPPTYTRYDEKRLEVENAVAKAVGEFGYKIAAPRIPLKLLAVCSGLAEYGRSNIAFVKGMGSFLRLTAVFTDMPLKAGKWRKPKVMENCQSCQLCIQACPTGAISKDRFLLRAERCLTYHNEKEAAIPFPFWIKKEWHNCLIGCIRCQVVCPENKPFIEKVGETADFTEQETDLLIKGMPPEELPNSLVAKMRILSLLDFYKELPRNLCALLDAS